MISNVDVRRLPLCFGLGLVVVAATLALAAGAAAQPAPLGPEVALDPEPSLYEYCPQVVGRRDGRFAVAWRGHRGYGESSLVALGDADGHVTGIVQPDGHPPAAELTTIPGGYRALWGRWPSAGFMAGNIELDGDTLPPVTLEVATSVRLSARPRGGYAGALARRPRLLRATPR